jgi:molybdate transport system ATP-binding protein
VTPAAPSRGHRLEEIRLEYAGVRLGGRWALREASFQLQAGQRWLLVGANGAGKTVLLKLLRGDLWPTPTGRERRTYRLGRETLEQPALARDRIAYLGPERQDRYHRYEWDLPVADVVCTGLFETDIPLQQPTPAQQRAIQRALESVGLAGLAARRFLSLSYGQRRRVLLARALVRRPDVLLLDEALNGLDARSRAAFLGSLARVSGPGTAWVLSTHRGVDVPRQITHVARLEQGRIVAAGLLAEVGPQLLPRRPRERRQPAPAPGPGASRETVFVRLDRVAVYRDYRSVLPRFDWSLRSGEHWCITGPNGSGKSTLVALLYGDLWPALGGRVERPALPAGASVEDWKRLIGLVSPELQASYAATACTAEDIAVSGLHSSIGLNERPSRSERRLAHRALRRFGILHMAGRRARELSYGQLRLALFARALVMPRRLLLLDEPFDGLDGEVRERAESCVDDAVRGGAQLVLATHHREEVPPYVRSFLELRPGRRPREVTAGARPRKR